MSNSAHDNPKKIYKEKWATRKITVDETTRFLSTAQTTPPTIPKTQLLVLASVSATQDLHSKYHMASPQVTYTQAALCRTSRFYLCI